jgi:hypothetical protein
MLIHNGNETSASQAMSWIANWMFLCTRFLFGDNFHPICSQMDVLRLTGDTPLLIFKNQSNVVSSAHCFLSRGKT